MNRVFLSLGSNKGDSFRNIKDCIKLISKVDKVAIINKSKIYTTKPMYNYNQKYFLNMVIEINTILDPEILLSKLLNIELKIGIFIDVSCTTKCDKPKLNLTIACK